MPAVLRRGVRVGKYRLERRIGTGAAAEVWAARDAIERRSVALKIVLPSVVDQYGRAEVERETRIAARLSHPNTVPIRNADWIDGRFVQVTELARTSLTSYAGARRSGQVALRVIRDVAAGLAYAHERRLMHRDVKPDNILIFADGHAALGDFGVSRFAGAEHTLTDVGTLGYMAPEQAYGRPTLSSDVFSLGLIAYELLSGKLLTWPFDWPPPGYARFTSRTPAPYVPVIRKACQFEPRRRYADAIRFHRALEKAEQASSRVRPRPRRRVKAPPPSPLAVQAELFRKAHGGPLRMRYCCHRCDAPIAEEMAYCPWCGSGENSFAEITSASLICPCCERGVLPEWTACPWCYEGRFEGSGGVPRRDPRAVRNCSRRGCAGQLRPFMRYCPLCKRKPARPWSHPDLPERCPRCRGPVSREFWRFCAWCGRREPGAASFRRR